MSQRLSATLLLIALASCQAAPTPADSQAQWSQEQWRWRIEQRQAELQGQIASFSSLLGARSVAMLSSNPDAYTPMAMPLESAGMSELTARLATLNDRVAQLTAAMSTSHSASHAVLPVEASHAHSAPTVSEVVDDAALEPLRAALLVLERQRQLHIENLANVQSQGYKLRQLPVTTTVHEASGLQLPQAGPVQSVMTTGALEITERSLDVAIDGEGFFAIILPDGSTGYTRNGNLHLNADGKLVTGAGDVVTPEITVPSDTLEISIDPEGRVSGRTAGCPDRSTVFGQLTIHRFVNPGGMHATGNNVLRPTEASGQPTTGTPGQSGLGLLKQGFLERSNVQITNELVNLQFVERRLTTIRRVLAGYGIYTR